MGRAPRAVAVVAVVLVLLGLASAPARAQQSEADVYVAQAIVAYEDHRWDDALGLLRQALEIDPGNVDALYYTGLVYSAQGRLEPAIDALEQARAKSPDDLAILYQLGLAYFATERYDRAEPLLSRIFAVSPGTDGLGYYIGFMRYRNKDYQGAVRAFQVARSTDPRIQQLTRFYAGLALAILGLPERAAAEVEQALRLQPASPLTGPAERLRASIVAARERERRFRADVRFGFLHDDNVPVKPEKSSDPVAETLRHGRRTSFGELAGVRLEYSWLRHGPWEAAVGYSFFQTYYNELTSFNVQDHLGFASVAYRGALSGMPYELGLQYWFEYMTLGGDEFLQRHSIPLSATIAENSWNMTALLARAEVKDFAEPRGLDPNEVRDGTNYLIGFVHYFRFSNDRHLIHVGYQFDRDDTEGRNYSYLGHRYLVGGQYTLPWGATRLKYDFEFHHRDYTHTNSLLPIDPLAKRRKRKDDEQIHVFRIEQPLPYNLTLAAEYQFIVNDSNLPVYDYNRNVGSLTLSWQY